MNYFGRSEGTSGHKQLLRDHLRNVAVLTGRFAHDAGLSREMGEWAGWLDTSARPAVRPRTFEGYRSNVEKHIVPSLGRTKLIHLTPDAVQALLNRLSEQGLQPQTVRNIHATLRRALNQAVR